MKMKKISYLIVLLFLYLNGISQCLIPKQIYSSEAEFHVIFTPTISFSHDSKYFCYVQDKKLKFFDLMEQKEKYEYAFRHSTSSNVDIAFHPNKNIVAVGIYTTVYLFDYNNGFQMVKEIEACKKYLSALAWSGDSLYTSGFDKKINIWNLNGELVKSYDIEGSAKKIYPMGNTIFYAGVKVFGASLRSIDVSTGKDTQIYAPWQGEMALTKDGATAYVVEAFTNLKQFDVTTKTHNSVIETSNLNENFKDVELSPDNTLLLYGGLNGKLTIRDIAGNKTCSDLSVGALYACAASPDNKYVAVLSDRGGKYVQLYALTKDGKLIETVKDTEGVYVGNMEKGLKHDDNAAYTWNDGKKYIGVFEKGIMTKGTVYYPDGKSEAYVRKQAERESIDIAYYVRITENEGLGSYVKKDMIVFARVFNIPADVIERMDVESIMEASKNIAKAQLEGKDYTFITYKRAESGEDYETFKKRLADKDGLPWMGASGNYQDFTGK